MTASVHAHAPTLKQAHAIFCVKAHISFFYSSSFFFQRKCSIFMVAKATTEITSSLVRRITTQKCGNMIWPLLCGLFWMGLTAELFAQTQPARFRILALDMGCVTCVSRFSYMIVFHCWWPIREVTKRILFASDTCCMCLSARTHTHTHAHTHAHTHTLTHAHTHTHKPRSYWARNIYVAPSLSGLIANWCEIYCAWSRPCSMYWMIDAARHLQTDVILWHSFPSCVCACGGVCSLHTYTHASQCLHRYSERYDNHTYIHTLTHTHANLHKHILTHVIYPRRYPSWVSICFFFFCSPF